MRRLAIVVLGAALAAAGGAGAAPFTGHFASLEAALADREGSLVGTPDLVLAKQLAACRRAHLVLLYAYADSASDDLKSAGKIARILEKALPAADPILGEVSGALDGLEGELAAPRAILELEIDLLAPAAAARAGKGLAAADLLAAEADLAPMRTRRAKLLGKALKRILATRKALRGGGTPGFQGPLNPSFEDLDPYATYPETYGVIVRNSANSYVGYLDVWRTSGGAFARTGAGAPHGVAKAGVGASYSINTGYHPGNLSQDGVNLSRSRRIRFEWDLTGKLGGACSTTGAYARAVVELRFAAPSGTTVVLGRVEVAPDPANGSFYVTGQSTAFDLPYLPEAGTLFFYADVAADPCPPPPPPTGPPSGGPTEGVGNWGWVMYLDNVRVE